LVGACLLGEKVRYDGQHKYDSFLVEALGHYVRKYEVGYLSRQVFLSPYPAELMLRNHFSLSAAASST
jgi:hypothetical protein